MKKINLLTILFAALLVSGNVWAQTYVCEISGVGQYESLNDAFTAATTQSTITMTSDVTIDELGSTFYASAPAGKELTLDLNGKIISAKSSASAGSFGVLDVTKGATLTIIDGTVPAGTNPAYGRGELALEHTYQTYSCNNTSTILNEGTLTIKSGKISMLTTNANSGVADYAIDNYQNYGQVVLCIIENGYIYASELECIRNYSKSKTVSTNLVITGGKLEGGYGLIFVQSSAECLGDISISGGTFESGAMPMIRFYSFGAEEFTKIKVNISGDPVCNVDAIRIQVVASETTGMILDSVVAHVEKVYPDIFNITGGTFASENYQIKSTYVDPDNGYKPTSSAVVTDHTLPTILSQDYYDKDNDGQSITITPVTPNNINTQAGWESMSSEEGQKGTLQNDGSAITYYTVEPEVVKEVAALEIKKDVVLTVKDGATLKVGDGGVLIQEGGKLIVEAGGILQVGVKGIEDLNGQELIVRSNTEKSGVVSLAPKALARQNTKLTVELTSKARNDGGAFYWQYIGIPTNEEPVLTKMSGNLFYLYEWDAENQDWLEATSFNKPFIGYIFTSNATTAGAQFSFKGNINNNQNVTFDLVPNWNLLANSYMAPIRLDSFFNAMGKTVGVETAISIYDANQGTYKVVTKNALKYDEETFKTLAPMQGFFINTTDGGHCTFDYSKCVWGQEDIDPLRAPARESSSNVNLIKIAVKTVNSSDEISLYEGDEYTPAFDNGCDATKFMNDKMNIYASLDNKELAALATDNLNGSQLSFQAGDEVEYTMTFKNINDENYVLVDTKNNARVAMTDGATYTFVATPNTTDVNRFQIVRSMPTDLQVVDATPAAKGIYTIMGQYVADVKMFDALPAGVYVVNGVKVVK